MGQYKIVEDIKGKDFHITFYTTGKKVHEVDCHNWDEVIEGEDQYGSKWVTVGAICDGEIIEVKWEDCESYVKSADDAYEYYVSVIDQPLIDEGIRRDTDKMFGRSSWGAKVY